MGIECTPPSQMAANGITLKPMRMGDLVPSSTKVAGKYVPPSKRSGSDLKGTPVLEKIDMSDKNFPTLGAVPVKAPTWGKHVVSKPEVKAEPLAEPLAQPLAVLEKKETLSDKIKEKIRLDAIAENERVSLDETDPWKMTDDQLVASGWVRLRMNSAREICRRGFSNQDDPCLPGFIADAPIGMSFEEYCHYRNVFDPASMAIPPNNTPCVASEDEGYYSD